MLHRKDQVSSNRDLCWSNCGRYVLLSKRVGNATALRCTVQARNWLDQHF